MELSFNKLRVDAGGEGTKGGHVIGHTGSGKPIYMKHGHSSHGSFTQAEHKEAETLHRQKALTMKGGDPLAGEHLTGMEHHRKQQGLQIASKLKTSKAKFTGKAGEMPRKGY